MSQVPSVGRTVLYTLSEQDAEQVNRRRNDLRRSDQDENLIVAGTQVHVGNQAEAGQVCPMVIVRTWGDTPESSVNGQVVLDGNDTLWVTSRQVGTGPGFWAWPVVTSR